MIKTLLKSVRQYKKASILAPIFVTLEVILEILIPYIMGYVIDYGVNATAETWYNNIGELLPAILTNTKTIAPEGAVVIGNITIVWQLCLVLLGLAALSLTFGVLSGRCAAVAGCGYASNLRQDLYYKIQNFSFANIDKFSTPSLITRITTDVTNIQMSYQMVIRVAVRSPMMLALAFVMSIRIKWQLSMIFLVAIPVLGTAAFVLLRCVHPIFKRVFERYDNLNNVVEENIRGVRVVKSYVREDYETKKFFSSSKLIYSDFVKAEKILAIAFPGINIIAYTALLCLGWFSAKFIWVGELQTGDFVSMITYTTQILMSMIMLAMILLQIVISKASMERVTEVLQEESQIQNPENPITELADGSITLENVSFSYKGKEGVNCLSGINIDIKSGETVGIIGGTGSGKTTMTQLIPRLYDATEGKVMVGGKDVRDYDISSLRNGVSMVLQKNTLFSGTIKDNLRWGKEDATDEEMKNACVLAQADGFITAFPNGYDTLIEQGGANVSGGQKQRLCIARALLKNPKILILDDSTSAVDTRTDALIRKAFKEVIPGTTKLIIAQRISSVMDADKIIVLDGGKVNGVGTHEELMANNEIYREVYDSQQKTGGDFDAERSGDEDKAAIPAENKQGGEDNA